MMTIVDANSRTHRHRHFIPIILTSVDIPTTSRSIENSPNRSRRKLRDLRRVAGISFLAIGLLIPMSANPAGAFGSSARIKYGTSVYGGGPANPCGDDIDPGVTREGEAEAAFKLNNSVKLTFSMRTHYDKGVASAIDVSHRLGYDNATTCGVAWGAKGKAPVDVLYFLWCGSGQRSAWCDTINLIPAAERSQGDCRRLSPLGYFRTSTFYAARTAPTGRTAGIRSGRRSESTACSSETDRST